MPKSRVVLWVGGGLTALWILLNVVVAVVPGFYHSPDLPLAPLLYQLVYMVQSLAAVFGAALVAAGLVLRRMELTPTHPIDDAIRIIPVRR